MSVEGFVEAIVGFVRQNQAWAVPVAFLVAFGESLCFLSIIWPGTAILVGISALLAASGMELGALWPAIVAAGLGGSLGYAISYWLGLYFKDDVARIWPFTTHPDLIPNGKRFFETYGAFGVFLGHFFGPVRAVIPVVAGMFAMPQLAFQIANIASAFLWALGVIAPSFLLVAFKDPLFELLREQQLAVAGVMLVIAFLNSIPRHLIAVPTLLAFAGLGGLVLFAGGKVWPMWLAGAAGALAADVLAYRTGAGGRHRESFLYVEADDRMMERAEGLVRRYGPWMMLGSKFSATWRAAIPLAEGRLRQPFVPFALVSLVSALVWSGVLLTPVVVAKLAKLF